MTSLLVIIVLILLSIALWQLTKIFHLTQVGKQTDDTQVANDKDNNIQGYLMFGFLAFIYIFSIYGLLKWGGLVLANPSSLHGEDIDSLMNITWVVIFFVQGFTQVLLHVFAFKYRGKKENKALYFADSNRLELIWSIIPAGVLAVLILYGLYAWTNIMFVDEKTEDVMVVELYAKQFGWEARYSGADNVLGKANVRYIEGVNTTGTDLNDPNAQDDKTVMGEFHIPKGKKILFKMRSQDVLHSAYMPHFRAQMNCVPGMVTQFAYVPTITTADRRDMPDMLEKVDNINKIRAKKSQALIAEGKAPLDSYQFDYLLLCNKICGASHYNMQMKLVVDTPSEFKEWLASKPTLVKAYKESKAGEEKPKDSVVVTTTKVMAQNIKK